MINLKLSLASICEETISQVGIHPRSHATGLVSANKQRDELNGRINGKFDINMNFPHLYATPSTREQSIATNMNEILFENNRFSISFDHTFTLNEIVARMSSHNEAEFRVHENKPLNISCEEKHRVGPSDEKQVTHPGDEFKDACFASELETNNPTDNHLSNELDLQVGQDVGAQERYACPLGNKELTRVNSLENHTNIHSGSKPHVCSICGQGFATLSNLSNHKKSCMNLAKEHKCNICGQQFRLRRDLNDHESMHNKEKPYVCDGCNKGFSTQCNLIRHKKKHCPLKTVINARNEESVSK